MLPHASQVGRTENERPSAFIFFEYLRHSRSHERLAQAHYITQQHASASVQVVRSQRYGLRLKVEYHALKFLGKLELSFALSRFLGEMVDHLQVDQVGSKQFLSGPTGLNEGRQLVGDVESKGVVPAVVEPMLQLAGGVLIQHIHVQFALPS